MFRLDDRASLVAIANLAVCISGARAATRCPTAKGITARFCVLSVGYSVTGIVGGADGSSIQLESFVTKLAGINPTGPSLGSQSHEMRMTWAKLLAQII